MWIMVTVAVLLVLGVAYVGVRQARHPVPPGRHAGADAQAQQQGKFWGLGNGGGGG